MNNIFAEENFETGGNTTWLDALAVLKRNKLTILLVFLAVVVGGYASLQFITEKYETRASLLVKLGRENTEIPSVVSQGNLLTTGVRKEELNSIVQMLSSRELIESTVDEIGVDAFFVEAPPPQSLLQKIKYAAKRTVKWSKLQYENFLIAANLQKDLSRREKAILGVESSLTVEPEKDSDVIGVRLRFPDPALSVRVVDVLLKNYLEKHIEIRRSDNAQIFFGVQVTSNKEELSALEKAKSALRARWNLSSVAEQRALLLKQLNDFVEQINQNESEKAMLQKQQAVMKTRLAQLPETLRSSEVTNPNPSVQSLKDRITTLQLERAKLSNNYTAKSPAIQKLTEEIMTLEKLLAQETPTLIGSSTAEINPVRQKFVQDIEEMDAKIAGLEAKTNQLRGPAKEIAAQIKVLDAGEAQLNDVERERHIAEDNYLNYSKKLEDARIADELDERKIANVTILSPPSAPIEPIYPRKLLIMGITLPAGLLLGIGLVLFLEYMTDRIRSDRDLVGIEGINFLGSFRG